MPAWGSGTKWEIGNSSGIPAECSRLNVTPACVRLHAARVCEYFVFSACNLLPLFDIVSPPRKSAGKSADTCSVGASAPYEVTLAPQIQSLPMNLAAPRWWSNVILRVSFSWGASPIAARGPNGTALRWGKIEDGVGAPIRSATSAPELSCACGGHVRGLFSTGKVHGPSLMVGFMVQSLRNCRLVAESWQ